MEEIKVCDLFKLTECLMLSSLREEVYIIPVIGGRDITAEAAARCIVLLCQLRVCIYTYFRAELMVNHRRSARECQ